MSDFVPAPAETAVATGRRARVAATAPRLIPPPDGAVVRLYRTGHGDCFLLAFPGATEGKPAYVLIDCGYKPGSPAYVGTKIADIARHIIDSTGGYIDVVVLTHEHQDHVNGFTKSNFKNLKIGTCWMAWTEDPQDALAEKLRARFKDRILALVEARYRLAAAGTDAEELRQIDDLLAFELGGDGETMDPDSVRNGLLGAEGPEALESVSMNKRAMKLVLSLAEQGARYLTPHKEVMDVPGASDVRVFVLGPPRDEELLDLLDPEGSEEFHGLAGMRTSLASYFAAAVTSRNDKWVAPFAKRYSLKLDDAFTDPQYGTFFTTRYGRDRPLQDAESRGPDDAPWRRIDRDWLGSADQFALAMNNQTNNSSLVLAFELGKGGKVLLFAADAQRGNWLSWAKSDWDDDGTAVTARDLLARTVLYKVGHHGSHNATLDGKAEDEHPNLAWMGRGHHAREFTAMITAVRKWAETRKGWDHPLKAIKDALHRKTSGRVFQTDTDIASMTPPGSRETEDWMDFLKRAKGEGLFFEYTVIR